MSADDKILILGGGQAAAQACASLRQFGYDGPIDVLADENDLPYQRPPLSKAYMKGELDRERLYFKMQDWYQSH
ncbi:MAG: FAD-dependent oxidoreductase, partial [Henriciella sp.]